MPIGILINCSVVVLGGIIGKLVGDRLSEELKSSLTLVFGISAMFIGTNSMIRVVHIPAVILALILGMAAGELLQVEERIKPVFTRVILCFKSTSGGDVDKSAELIVSTAVLFCASGLGIFGVLTEGFSGDSSILISKSVLDFFTAIVFAAQIGYLVSGIAIPQFVIFISLFLVSRLIMPFVTGDMISDFTACGGVISFAVGLRICNIRKVPVMNMVPALILVMPLSWLWECF